MLLHTFLRLCQQQPDALALREQERRLNYSHLYTQAQSIAAALQFQGVRPGQPVAIHLERGIDAAIAVFGILLAGACYVPLDLKNPPQRLAFILKDARAALAIGQGEAPSWLDSRLWLDIARCLPARPEPVETQPASLAAILYTSGSTGQPRGVALSHAAIRAFADWAAELVDLQPGDRIASTTPFFFDLSTFDLYAVLSRGASLHFVPGSLTMAPARLSAWLRENRISGWYSVPSLLAFLAYKGNLAQTELATLRFLLFAGEVFPTPALTDLAASLPQTALYNCFGPTETNVCCYWPVQRDRLQADKNIPIGKPAANCELYIHSESGELWVRGPTLASGYWSEGRLHAFLNERDWYATGDRVSLENGEYRFHGRLGRMMKCSGYRVEPAEIEAAANTISGVRECAVTGIPDPTAGRRPALALCLDAELTVGDIRQTLLRLLPAYMQPCRYLVLEALPRLPNGKLDYRKLQDLLQA